MVEGAGGKNTFGNYLGRMDKPDHGVGEQVVVGGRKRKSEALVHFINHPKETRHFGKQRHETTFCTCSY